MKRRLFTSMLFGGVLYEQLPTVFKKRAMAAEESQITRNINKL